jgi:ankyrin repeat protein
MNLVTERGWLPLHYAAYVGDKETVYINNNITSIEFFLLL